MSQAHTGLIGCEYCGAVYRRRVLAKGQIAVCTRCKAVLARHSALRPADWLALALAALAVFAIANAYPVASMSAGGTVRSATLLQAVAVTAGHGHMLVAVMVALSAFAVPLLQLCLLAWVLWPLAVGRRPAGFEPALRLLDGLRPWSMVPVFLLGVIVAVVKVSGSARVSAGAGLWGFAALTVLLTVLGRLDADTLRGYVQREGLQAGDPSPGPARAARKPDHLARTWALLLAAAILYVPANVYPVMHVQGLTGASSPTILGGVMQLWSLGSWDLAVIVFVASVVVPLTKLLALALLAWATTHGRPASLVPRTRMYRMVEFIGQWSMLDVYVVILLAALADFPGLMQISAGVGAAAFGVVVVLTMLAAMSFDPRAAWDAVAPGADALPPQRPRGHAYRTSRAPSPEPAR